MRRLSAAAATFAILVAASPGILSPGGSSLLAAIALVPWALACRTPARRAFLGEWLVAGLGMCALCAWLAYIWWGIFGFIALVPGFYFALAGVLLRALRPWPLALSVPAAWVAAETLRCTIEPPFGFGWMRLGTYAHDAHWIAGAARVAGASGLSWVLASIAGGIADLVRIRRREPGAPRAVTALALGAGPLALAAIAAAVTAPPPVVDGPRVMLVQPAFEQHRKMESKSDVDLFRESVELTRRGLEAARAAGEPTPDLVAWGETMYPAPVAAEGLLAAFDRGVRAPDWTGWAIRRQDIERMLQIERAWVRDAISARSGGLLPDGTSFLSGAEVFAERDGDIRRHNAVVLWDSQGGRRGLGGKVHLVPGAEQLAGFERIEWIRAATHEVAGYVPDLIAFERAEVLPLETQSGRTYRFSASVCFDNAYETPYVEAVRAEPVDFHLVCSNEAWYETSFEYDQMVALSRSIAVATGRSVVRATNAGITLVLGPSGAEIARLRDGSRDRMIAGTLRVTVPVPAVEAASQRTPFVATERLWFALWLGMPIALWLAARRRSLHASRDALGGAAAGSGRA